MREKDNSRLNWNIELNFNFREEKPEVAPVQPTPKIPPRQVIAAKYPKILARIELLWGSLELHKYLGDTVFTDREKRQGFPVDVLKALAEIHAEHALILKEKKLISEDVWDLQPKNRYKP